MTDDLPEHVAVVQDGNRRYARERGEADSQGHEHGAETTEEFLDWSLDIGIPEVTLYSFSTENFERSQQELSKLFDLLQEKLYELGDDDQIHSEGVKVAGVGEREMLPERVVDALEYVEGRTSEYSHLKLNVALAYGGRQELVTASRNLLERVERGELKPSEITEENLSNHLYVGDTDLMIRTGGEHRTSNFLPWQSWGNEAVVEFLPCYWPEFTRQHYEEALERYRLLEGKQSGAGDVNLKLEEPAD